MTITHKVFNFPQLAIESQLFHVPGAYSDGGLTSGGARMYSPEPGGRSVLEVTPSLQVREWETPFASWIMSKTNGEIFKIQMTQTPQIANASGFKYPFNSGGVPWDNEQPWNNGKNWNDDGGYVIASTVALEGSIMLTINAGTLGEILRVGHVIGIGNSAHIIDDIDYNGSIAEVKLKPPLRKDVAVDETIFLRPYFTGMISNGSEIRNSYDASNVGYIRPNRIIFDEVIL